jgi:hypothetical protein
MAPRKTKESLERDLRNLRKALRAHDSGAMAHLDAIERSDVVKSIQKRIAELDAKLEAIGD